MFNADFYPTPDELIAQLYEPYRKGRFEHQPYILEPSAGKGNILDFLTKKYSGDSLFSSGNVRKSQCYAIETEPELQDTLRGKGYTVIGSDFLKFDDPMHIDLVIMNPPFSDAASHLLKAWNVVHDGGAVACILNAETIRNPHSEERKLLTRIIDAHGCVEYVGRPFACAERPTDVECVIVRLDKPGQETIEFDHGKFDFDSEESEREFSASPIASANMVEALVNQYQCAVTLLKEHRKLASQYNFYTQGIVKYVHDNQVAPKEGLNDAIATLKGHFWRYIFDKTKLGQRMTSKFRKDFETFTAQQSQMAFTVENIVLVLEAFLFNQDQLICQAIEHVFDTITGLHEKNTVHTEGWKTNKSWKVAEKVILPRGISYEDRMLSGGRWSSGGSFRYTNWSLHYTDADIYMDFDRALCFMSGRKIEDIRTVRTAIEERISYLNNHKSAGDHNELFESEFFRIRIFKKGTVHLVFKDRDLLARFNIAAAKQKNWVGAGY